jgi:hypothetical protein
MLRLKASDRKRMAILIHPHSLIFEKGWPRAYAGAVYFFLRKKKKKKKKVLPFSVFRSSYF